MIAMAVLGGGCGQHDDAPRPIVGTWEITTIGGQPMWVSVREALRATGQFNDERPLVTATMVLQFQEAGGIRGRSTITAPMRSQTVLGMATFDVVVTLAWGGTWHATDARLTTAVTQSGAMVTVYPTVIATMVHPAMQAIADAMAQAFKQTESGPYTVVGDVLTLPDDGAVFARRPDTAFDLTD